MSDKAKCDRIKCEREGKRVFQVKRNAGENKCVITKAIPILLI